MNDVMQFQTNICALWEMENWGHCVDNEDRYFFIGYLEDEKGYLLSRMVRSAIWKKEDALKGKRHDLR